MDAHRRLVRSRVSAEDETTVVRDVQPLVSVGGPGVGVLYTFREMPQGWARGRPESERPVYMDPSASLLGSGADSSEGVDSAGVHVARLGTHYGPFRGLGEGVPQHIRPHPALTVGRDRPQVGGPEAQKAQSAVYRDVALLADDNPNWRCADQSVDLDIPVGRLEHAVAGGRERGEVRHLAAGYESV